MSVDVHALDRADPPLLTNTSSSLGDAVPRLRAVVSELLDAVRGTAGGWSGVGHDAWAVKVEDLAERVDTAADSLADLGATTRTLAGAAADGQTALRAAAATAASFGQSLGLPDVEWAAIRMHYEALLRDAGDVFDAVAQQAPAAPAVPLVCPPPPPPPERPWWDDLLFGDLPVVLDDRCQPLRFLEGGVVRPSMLRWVRAVGRADKLDEPFEVLARRVVTAHSYDKEAMKHAKIWFGGQFNNAMRERWIDLVVRGLRSSEVYTSVERTRSGLVPTLNHLHFEGRKHLLVEVYLGGRRNGEVMAVKVLSQQQLTAARRAIRGTK